MCCHCEMYLPHSPYSTSKSHSKCKSSIISPLLQKHYNPLVCFGNFKIKIILSRHFYGSFFFFFNSYFDTFSLAWKANVSLYWFYSSPLANIDFPSPPPHPQVMNKSKINVSVLLHDNSYSVPFVSPFQLARNFIIRDSSLQTATRHPSQSYFHSR